MTAYEWVQGDHETVETDLATLDGAPSDLDLSNRTVHYVLRHYRGAKVADTEASVSGTTATVDLTPENLSRPNSHEAEWVITGGADDPTSLPKDEPIDVDVRPSVDDGDDVAEPLPEDATVDVLTTNGLDGSITGGSLVESFVDANLGVDANDSLFVPDSEVASALDGQSIAPQEFTLGSEPTISGYEGALSVDANDNLVAADSDSQLTDEEVQDIVDAFVSDGTNVTISYDDTNDVLTVSADHDHSGDTLGTTSSRVTTTYVGTADTEELFVGTESKITGYGGALSVDSNDNLVAIDTQSYSKSTSGSTTLSSGDAAVDTGVATDSGYYDVNLNPGAADIGMSLDGSGTNYVIHFEENTTSVENPTVGWQLIRSQL